MTLSAMPLGPQCAVEMQVRVVELVWMRGIAGRDIAVGRQVADEPDFQGLAGLHAQCRGQPAFVGAEVEAHAADVAIGVSASQAGAEHAVRRAADLGLDERLVHGRRNRQVRHAEFGHVGVCIVGLPQRSTLPQRQRAERQPACSTPLREARGPSHWLAPTNLCSLAMIPPPREMPGR
jgi:hypothetical protein